MKHYLIALVVMVICCESRLQATDLEQASLQELQEMMLLQERMQRHQFVQRLQEEQLWQEEQERRQEQQGRARSMLERRVKVQVIKHRQQHHNNYHCTQTRLNKQNQRIHQPQSNKYASKNNR